MSEENVTADTAAEETTQAKAPESVDLNSFFGVKAGMTRIFDSEGNHIPVTVIKLENNFITQVKTTEKDGYNAYQVGYYAKREKQVIFRCCKNWKNSSNGCYPAHIGARIQWLCFSARARVKSFE